MGIEEILSKIREDADREASNILDNARREVEQKVKEAEDKARAKANEILKRAEREIENRKKAELAKIRQEVKREILNKKEEIIQICFKEALERLRNLSGKDYEKLVEKLIKRGAKEIGKECTIIPSREEDSKIAKKLGLKVSKNRVRSSGGVVIVSDDGKVSVDNTFEEILKREEASLRMKIGNLLFGREMEG